MCGIIDNRMSEKSTYVWRGLSSTQFNSGQPKLACCRHARTVSGRLKAMRSLAQHGMYAIKNSMVRITAHACPAGPAQPWHELRPAARAGTAQAPGEAPRAHSSDTPSLSDAPASRTRPACGKSPSVRARNIRAAMCLLHRKNHGPWTLPVTASLLAIYEPCSGHPWQTMSRRA